ncbi:HD domain-containing protein [Rhizobium tubonense]|uniref:HD/PDEase domain-containing protein n=1 Tax=Rhizobium tubonense TaxID=484088 RepID=A0A2W4C2N6_9HYPH|nr:HD domain-containing protein [Rhizobium tubonense]PZM08069.1 hypothetical protein CPY51_30465 [Rhizobium tubonense]
MTDTSSRVAGVRKLEKHLFSAENLQFERALNSAFDRIGFTEAHVAGRIGSTRSEKQKALKDSVWGMMEFDEGAMKLIDSPLLQRLRRIKQLGFSYLTYPSAEHSRFPHSIGMAHVVGKFIAAIDRQRDKVEMEAHLEGFKRFEDLQPLRPQELIHAALLHDIGHLPFSHAAESAIEGSKDRFRFGGFSDEDFTFRAANFLKARVSLSETISIAIVLSPRFRRYYEKYIDKKADDEAVHRIACLIAGQRVQDNCGNIQGIISSSSVDADKIDYVNRDAAACGIPVGVDVSRVFLGSSLIGIDATKAKKLAFSPKDRLVFALNASGWDTYDEIIRARSTLYQRVYLHSFTRTAEAIFARALKLNTGSGDSQIDDAIGIWSLSDNALLDELARSTDGEVATLGASLRDRQMPKKACALSTNLLKSLVHVQGIFPKIFDGPENVNAFSTLRKQIADPFRRKFTQKNEEAVDSVHFENSVIYEANEIYKALQAVGFSDLPTMPLSNVVLIDIAGLDHKKSDAPVFQHGELLSSELLTNVRGVSDASDHFRQIGYVMAPQEWREIVSLAARTIIYKKSLDTPNSLFENKIAETGSAEEAERRFGPLQVKPLTILDIDGLHRRTGTDRKRMKRIMSELETASYFDSFPALAIKTDESDVALLSKKFEKFDGEGGWSINSETVAAFIDQFPPGLREDLREALATGDFIPRDTAVKLIAEQLREIASTVKNVIVVPLSTSSGGAIVAGLRSLLKTDKSISVVSTLREAVADPGKSTLIVFADDNAASGTQAAAQLWAYSGRPRDSWPGDLRSEKGLVEKPSAEEMAALKSIDFKIVVAYGHPQANVKLTAACQELGFTGFDGIVPAMEIGKKINWSVGLKEYLSNIGAKLVAFDLWQKDLGDLNKAEVERCEQNAFGYGNIGGLTILQNTVPTSTATAFWMPGIVDGRPWTPLAIRQGRLSGLTLA